MSSDMFDVNSTDQVTKERAKCMNRDCAVRPFVKALEACQKRLDRKPYTAETCHEETVDLVEALDVCMADKAFLKLK